MRPETSAASQNTCVGCGRSLTLAHCRRSSPRSDSARNWPSGSDDVTRNTGLRGTSWRTTSIACGSGEPVLVSIRWFRALCSAVKIIIMLNDNNDDDLIFGTNVATGAFSYLHTSPNELSVLGVLP